MRVDPAVPVTEWGLSDEGHARLVAFAARVDLSAVTAIRTSAERKARETGAGLAARLGLVPVACPGMGENDRTATGYLPPPAFEAAADAFFAAPDQSFRGWETARAAQARIVAACRRAERAAPPGDLLLCGHGAVGTLLWCHLAQAAIDRRHDQPPGGGCLWSAPRGGRPAGGWQRMETW
ncbi:histidine phosphatase family protein [Pseudooceanicola nanhaiensis]|uniref:histidine phosphatase family protein n=1 Tax=Pseudooceanicola nanhaiensis TaxID=375761 RepID=UPI00405A2499